MKKFILFATVMALFASCSQDDMSNGMNENDADIKVSVQDFVYDGAPNHVRGKGQSKVALKYDGTALKFSWQMGDQVGVFGQTDNQQVGLKMKNINSESGLSAIFESNDFKLDGGKNYMAYYPLINDVYLEPIIPVDYTGQVQTSNNSTEHLGAKDYIFTPWTTATGENNIGFKFQHISAVLWISIKMPDNTTAYKSVTLSAADAAFTTSAKIKLADVEMAHDGNRQYIAPKCITEKSMANAVTLNFNGTVTADENNMLNAWMMLLPADFTSREMTVTVTPVTGEPFVYTINPKKNFLSGKAYKLTVENNESDEWVDLGLPSGTLWASKNVGAEKMTDYGNYHSWGDSEIITSNNYKDYNGFYILSNLGHYVDYQGSSDYDIAKILWGGDWVTPNQDDFIELVEKCKTLEWKNIDGVNGLFITGNNGKSIFLPANGDRYVTGYYAVNEVCAYWTSEFKARYYVDESVGALFTADEDNLAQDLIDWEFIYGCAIRPVIKKKK